MSSNRERLIRHLVEKGYLKTPIIIETFKKIDRKDFVLPEYEDLAYLDEAMPIGYGQTISQPLTVAFMLELLCGSPDANGRGPDTCVGKKILDVGSGSGWTTALLAYIAGEQSRGQRSRITDQRFGMVFGVEKIPELVEFGKRNIAKYKFKNAEILPAGQEFGLPEEAPLALSSVEGFDKILVSAAAEELPQELVNQLKIGGRLVIPILNSVWKIDKTSKKEIKKEEYFGFSFVPLVSS